MREDGDPFSLGFTQHAPGAVGSLHLLKELLPDGHQCVLAANRYEAEVLCMLL